MQENACAREVCDNAAAAAGDESLCCEGMGGTVGWQDEDADAIVESGRRDGWNVEGFCVSE